MWSVWSAFLMLRGDCSSVSRMKTQNIHPPELGDLLGSRSSAFSASSELTQDDADLLSKPVPDDTKFIVCLSIA